MTQPATRNVLSLLESGRVQIHRVSCATSTVRRTDTSSDSQDTRHFTMLSDTSALKTFPLRGSVANELSTVWPSRSVRLNSDLNCRKIGSGNCPDDCRAVPGSTATATLPSTHDRSRLSLMSNLLSFVRDAWQSISVPTSTYCIPYSLPA